MEHIYFGLAVLAAVLFVAYAPIKLPFVSRKKYEKAIKNNIRDKKGNGAGAKKKKK